MDIFAQGFLFRFVRFSEKHNNEWKHNNRERFLFVCLLGKDKTGGESFGNNGNRFIEYHKNHSNQVTEQNWSDLRAVVLERIVCTIRFLFLFCLLFTQLSVCVLRVLRVCVSVSFDRKGGNGRESGVANYVFTVCW